jgi:FkbM family methyltransferase
MRELEQLLSRDPEETAAGARSHFDRIAGSFKDRVVLHGAGRLGRRVAAALRGRMQPLAFSDKNPALCGTRIDGVEVLLPEEAARRFGDSAVFVVTVWNAQSDHRFPETRDALECLGATHVTSALSLFCHHADRLLPYYCLDLPDVTLRAHETIGALYDVFADDTSREILLGHVRFRVMMDYDALPVPLEDPSAIYFPEKLLRLRESAGAFIDCGAYDGDSWRGYQRAAGRPAMRAHLLEPDPTNAQRLRRFLSERGLEHAARVHEVAVGARSERIRFDATGELSSAASALGAHEVQCVALDDLLGGEKLDFVKMDVEGDELDALAGGANCLAREQPTLAISAYHRPDHLWRIPLALKRLAPRHRLHLRQHGYEGWDLVCYAVAPRHWP